MCTHRGKHAEEKHSKKPHAQRKEVLRALFVTAGSFPVGLDPGFWFV